MKLDESFYDDESDCDRLLEKLQQVGFTGIPHCQRLITGLHKLETPSEIGVSVDAK